MPSKSRRAPPTQRRAAYVLAQRAARRAAEERQAPELASKLSVPPPAPVAIAKPHGLDAQIPFNRRDIDDDVILTTIEASEDLYGNGDPVGQAMPWIIEAFQRAFILKIRDPGQEWSAWYTAKSYAPEGYIFWFGFSPNVPAKVIESVRSDLCFCIPQHSWHSSRRQRLPTSVAVDGRRRHRTADDVLR